MDHKGLVPFEHTTFELGNLMDHKNSLLLSHLQRRCFIIYHAIAEVGSLGQNELLIVVNGCGVDAVP